MDIVFGPVPSRRLGRSLGINTIPAKHCCYSCRYCQVGPTPQTEIVRHAYHPPERVCEAVARRLEALRRHGEPVDALTLVPDGEPTLDSGLGELIDGLRRFGPRVAVISNAALIWREDVRAELARADWVSLKVDSVDAATWRALNRPHPRLQLDAILAGIRAFAADYRGILASETLLVAGVNDDAAGLEAVAAFLAGAGIRLAYLSVPLRPPADPGVACQDAASLTRAWHTLASRVERVELLDEYEGDDFAARDDPRRQLLAIAAVHPLRESAVRAILAGAAPTLLRDLLDSGALCRVQHAGEVFYVHRPGGR